MNTVLILSNHPLYTYNLRKDLIQRLIDAKYKVVIALPEGEKIEQLIDMGCTFIHVPLERRGTNPISDLKLLKKYITVIKHVKPSIVLTYTLKPNLYGGIACRLNNIDEVIHTVTGLGTVFVRNVWYKKLIVFLNKFAFKSAKTIAFMNEDNKELYRNLDIVEASQNTIVTPGSGVNLDYFKYSDYPCENEVVKFSFIARVLKDKGIEEFLLAAKKFKETYGNVAFEVVGFVDELKYEKLLKEYEDEGVINYLGKKNDMPKIMRDSHCIVLPSYGEGRGTVLQEAAAIGRPLITTDAYGCRDNVEENINGFLCEVKNYKSLQDSFLKFYNLDYQTKKEMGRASRKKAEKEFDRSIIVDIYIKEIEKIIERRNTNEVI